MKVYFTASARGNKSFGQQYQEIYSGIERLGNINLDDLIISVDENSFYEGSHSDRVALYKQSMIHIKNADLIILEVSLHSLSMGFVMQKALDMGKPVIALYFEKNLPYFASGIDNDKLQLLSYNKDNIDDVLKNSFDYAQDLIDVRFNFFISPPIGRYLDWISKVKKIPRSVYLRALIEREMRENKEYKDE
jgi:hypothetical protein